MVTLTAREITLEEVRKLLGFQPLFRGQFEDFLVFAPLSELEQQNLDQIANELMDYLAVGNISEGQARQISITPLLRLAGYHPAPITLRVEEDIQQIYIEDKDTHIRGRFDLVAVHRIIETSPGT